MHDLLTHQGTLFDKDPEDSPARREIRVRARLLDLLETARAAATMPWNRQREEVFETIFHQSSNWLPPSERDALRDAFGQELARLRAAR